MLTLGLLHLTLLLTADEPRLTPAREAAAKMLVPPGFSVRVFATEPQVSQPISFTTDPRGRLWICECNTYADREKNFDVSQTDRVVILDDTNGDGAADSRIVFWDQGKKLTSVEVGFDGVYVLCAPQLLFIPDRDHDDVPDGPPTVLLDGFDAGPIRHNIVNGLKWGPDGWLYGRHGIQATSYVGKPTDDVSQRTKLNCSLWRYHPQTAKFEVITQGLTNAWGFDFDDHGQMFQINTVIGHLWHVVPGAVYERMYGAHFNPHLYGVMEQTADHYHWDRSSGEQWSDIRKAISSSTDKAGGGHAHCGLMIYLGDNWPTEYRNSMFTVNLHGLRINNDRIERFRSAYVGKHAPDFLLAHDPWFRGIDLIGAPDGSVYVADWTDVGECHENDGVSRESGRIYKIFYGKLTPPKHKDLAKLTDAQLVELQLSPNDWNCRQARHVLQQRYVSAMPSAELVASLYSIVQTHPDVTRKLRALWALNAIRAANRPWLLSLLEHPEEHLRLWALRLLMDQGASDDPALAPAMLKLAVDPSSLVRLFTASALRQLPADQRWPIAQKLASHASDAVDRNLMLMIWYALESAVPQGPTAALQLAGSTPLPIVRQHIARRLTHDLESAPDDVRLLVDLVQQSTAENTIVDLLTGMNEALKGWSQAKAPTNWSAAADKLSKHESAAVRSLTQELSVVFGDGRALDQLRKIATDKDADPQVRRQALRRLAEKDDSEGLQKLLANLLNDKVQSAEAVRGLARHLDLKLARQFTNLYPAMIPEAKEEAIAALVGRAVGADALLDAIKDGRISRSALTAYHARQIDSLGDEKVREKLKATWGEVRAADEKKSELIAQYEKQFTSAVLAKANVAEGEKHFAKNCSTCHVLFGQGKKVGPDLTGANRQNLHYLLENIIDPSASVAADFKMSIILMDDGRTINGVTLDQTDRTLVVQMAKERIVLDRSQIESIKSSNLSLMPDGILQPLSEEQIRDLIGYLMSKR